MRRRTSVLISCLTAVFTTTLTINPFSAPARAVTGHYAIRDVRIVTMAGPQIDKGTVLMLDGLIESVGVNEPVPPDAIVIDGTGLTAYPGFIDMANPASVDLTDAPGARAAGAGGGPPLVFETLEEAQRARRAAVLRPDFEAARHARLDDPIMRNLASAGITTVLAVPPSGLVRGQSALINVAAPPVEPQIGNVADYRRGLVVVKSPVAQHIAFVSGGARGGYPVGLLGTIAFLRQSFLDAQWQRDARAYYDKHSDRPRPVMEPALDALLPVLERRLPAAFEANTTTEISRALALAKEFALDPIIVGGAEAAELAAEIKGAGGRVIYSLDFPTTRDGGRAAGAAADDEPLRVIRARQNAPKGPAALVKAGVPIAFTSGGLEFSLFMRNAARTVKDGGLAEDFALAALTSEAARMAGVGNQLGTIQKGRIANLVLTDGNWTDDRTRIRQVFVDGRPVEIDIAPVAGGRRGGRGAQP